MKTAVRDLFNAPVLPGLDYRDGFIGTDEELALIAQIDGVDYTIAAGESISFDARLPHRYRNTSSSPTEIILSVTPPNP